MYTVRSSKWDSFGKHQQKQSNLRLGGCGDTSDCGIHVVKSTFILESTFCLAQSSILSIPTWELRMKSFFAAAILVILTEAGALTVGTYCCFVYILEEIFENERPTGNKVLNKCLVCWLLCQGARNFDVSLGRLTIHVAGWFCESALDQMTDILIPTIQSSLR